jgi:hypothetical protein
VADKPSEQGVDRRAEAGENGGRRKCSVRRRRRYTPSFQNIFSKRLSQTCKMISKFKICTTLKYIANNMNFETSMATSILKRISRKKEYFETDEVLFF